MPRSYPTEQGVDLSAIEMHIKSGGVPLLTRTMRLKKRFGSGNTDFSGSNIKASSASGMMNFGVPEDGADDSALNVMSRDSLLQATVNASAKPGVHADLEDFEFEIEKSSYLASMEYDMLRGANNVTAAWHGGEADRRLQPLFPRSPSLVESDDQATNTEHILFSLQSPNTGLVGFEVLGILNNHRLQLSLQLNLGCKAALWILRLSQSFSILVSSHSGNLGHLPLRGRGTPSWT